MSAQNRILNIAVEQYFLKKLKEAPTETKPIIITLSLPTPKHHSPNRNFYDKNTVINRGSQLMFWEF